MLLSMKITFSIEIGSSVKTKSLFARALPYVSTGVAAFLRARGDERSAATIEFFARESLKTAPGSESAEMTH